METLERETNSSSSLKPCDYFDIIAGTSTGGIISIILGRLEFDVPLAIESFREFMGIVFKKTPNNYASAGVADIHQSTINTSATATPELKVWLQKLVARYGRKRDLKLLDEIHREYDPRRKPKRKVLVTAKLKDGGDGEPVLLRSYPSIEASSSINPSIWEAACATPAMPPFFDVVEFGWPLQRFLDDSQNNVNPAKELYREAKDMANEVAMGRWVYM
ncbi:hypothetical protein DFH27DRAFT_173364 [Peziza echinospora]|nr:hypothetical protein DFH27DRAFT_173364 [Peziza echinospora]